MKSRAKTKTVAYSEGTSRKLRGRGVTFEMGWDHAVRDLKKTTAWKWFSKYIRRRDANGFGFARCCSCARVQQWKVMDAGHYLKATNRAVFFCESNVSAQCKNCNMFLNGNEAEHRKTLVKRWGEKQVDWIESQRGIPRKYYRHELKEIAKVYRLKFHSLTQGEKP